MLNEGARPRLLPRVRGVPSPDEAGRKAPPLKASLLNSGHPETRHSSPKATRFTGFTAARVTVRIFAAATREDPTFCDLKSR